MGNEQSAGGDLVMHGPLNGADVLHFAPDAVEIPGTRKRRAAASPPVSTPPPGAARKWTRKPGTRKRTSAGAQNGDASSEDPAAPAGESTDSGATKPRALSTPSSKFIEWAPHEDEIIRNGVREHGAKWTLIAKALPGRTDNAVRNRWKRLEEGETWRQAMVGEGVDVHQIPPEQVPGYKCRKCGQPKRGHTCPFNAPPLGAASPPTPPPRNSRPPQSAESLEVTPSGRIDLAGLHALLATEGPGVPLPPAGGSARSPARGAGAGAGAVPNEAPAVLARTSTYERLLGISRDFSMSFLRGINGSAAAPPPPMPGPASGYEAEREAAALAADLQASARPPPLERNQSSIERFLSKSKELSRSFLADLLGLTPSGRQGSHHSDGRGGPRL